MLRQPNSDNQKFVDADTVVFSVPEPSENKPTNDYVWRGQSNDPKLIRIDSVGIEGFIQNVGIDQNQEIAVPNNVFKAGWFVDSVRPGETGLSIIDGHVDGLQQSGAIFKNLPKIQIGDVVTIVFGDNSEKKFAVFGTTNIPENESAAILFSQSPTATNQLNLITCSGNYSVSELRYDERYIVSAELINL